MFSNLTLGKTKWDVILATIFVLSLFALLGVALASFATTSNSASTAVKSSIKISPVRSLVYNFVTVTGVGFLPDKSVSISLAGQSDSTLTNSSGDFTFKFQVLPTPAGLYTVTAADGTHSASTRLRVIPHLTFGAHHYLPPGGSSTATGSGFAGNSLVKFTLSNGVTVGSVTSTSVGGFSTQVTVPANTAAGIYKLIATDASGNSASTTFHVT